MNGVTSRCIPLAQGAGDCTQRVNYAFGLVLGVDEFVDEQCYFLEKEYMHNRGLHGYGTVSGLLVGAAANGDDIEIQVQPGIGIDQYGRLFIVRTPQCASLLGWLADQQVPAGAQAIYVVAHYDECQTALVPIAGQPCATSSQLLSASRLQDSFEIALVREPPDHSAHTAVVNLSEFLSRFRVVPNGADLGDLGSPSRLAAIVGGPLITQAPDAFRTHIDQVVEQVTGTPGAQIIGVQPAAVEALLDDIFAYWVTEVRPALIPSLIDPDAPASAGGAAPASEILLARIDLTLPDNGVPALDALVIDNSVRPYLLHTQLIQELYDIPDLAGEGGATDKELSEWATTTDVAARDLSLWLHIGEDLDLVNNQNIFLQRVSADGSLEDLAIELVEDTARRNAVGRYYRIHTFVDLDNGDFLLLRFDTDQITVGGAGTLADFISGAAFIYPNYQPSQKRLFAFHVVDRGQAGITEERVRELILQLTRPQQPVIPFVTVTPITDGDEASAYELWFHLDGVAEQNEGAIENLSDDNFAFYVEPQPGVVEQVAVEFDQLRPNLWYVRPVFDNQPVRSLVRMAFSLDRQIGINAFSPPKGGVTHFETVREYIDNSEQRLDGVIAESDRLGPCLLIYVREQGRAGRLDQ